MKLLCYLLPEALLALGLVLRTGRPGSFGRSTAWAPVLTTAWLLLAAVTLTCGVGVLLGASQESILGLCLLFGAGGVLVLALVLGVLFRRQFPEKWRIPAFLPKKTEKN